MLNQLDVGAEDARPHRNSGRGVARGRGVRHVVVVYCFEGLRHCFGVLAFPIGVLEGEMVGAPESVLLDVERVAFTELTNLGHLLLPLNIPPSSAIAAQIPRA